MNVRGEIAVQSTLYASTTLEAMCANVGKVTSKAKRVVSTLTSVKVLRVLRIKTVGILKEALNVNVNLVTLSWKDQLFHVLI